MKKIYPCIIALFFLHSARAQLTVDATLSPETIVEDVFLANGIFVSNITYNYGAADAPNSQFGTFNSTSANVGISSGIVMATGSIDVTIGPNNSGAASGTTDFVNFGSTDPDLMALVPGYTSNDWSVVEFDLVATGDSLAFTYVFGSEEYLEWVGSAFNDHFGFFISGPGISGPYSNGGVNIATVPGTDLAVAINNVNAFDNSAYYVDNGDGFTSPFMDDAYYIQFDGFTTPLVAAIGSLTIGEIYHIKLAIADAGDGILDSGVFLQGDSFVQFCSPEVEFMPGECLLSQLDAQVHYTEDCGVVQLFNYSDMNIETTGCYYEMGDGGTTAACTQGITYEYAEPGSYTIKLVYQVNEFEAQFEIATLPISDVPPAQPVLSVAGDQLTVNNWDGTSTLQWYLDGVVIPGATATLLDADYDGYYTVTANNGCPISSEPVFVQSVANAAPSDVLAVYPNPCFGQVNVKAGANVASLRITDISAGREIIRQSVSNQSFSFQLVPGMYQVSAFDNKGLLLLTSSLVVQ